MTTDWHRLFAMILNTYRLPGLQIRILRAKNFTEVWTRKESVVKWLGTGLTCGPRKILPDDSQGIPDKSFQISSLYVQAGDT